MKRVLLEFRQKNIEGHGIGVYPGFYKDYLK